MAGDGDATAKCRETRRRRIEMRQFVPVAGTATSPPAKRQPDTAPDQDCAGTEKRARSASSDPLPPPMFSGSASSSGSSNGEAAVPAVASTSGSVRAVDSPVLFGSVALSGRTREMEDAISVRPGFFRRVGDSPLHFFAVFDGHGGSHVSALCKERMHVLLAEELAREFLSPSPAENEEVWWRAAVRRTFARLDELALRACACGSFGGSLCLCELAGIESDFVGSTAVAAMVGRDRLLVANCGDSRAVLCRGGQAVPLTQDHKPDRPDELSRIEAAGGRVIYHNGARVQGILAMSRALGDKFLKPVVISEPEISIVGRTPEDDCLVIASDGLWDVIPNELACNIARRCLMDASPGRSLEDVSGGVGEKTNSVEGDEQASDARCSLAAALLARLALGRHSRDNISVIVIDLRRG